MLDVGIRACVYSNANTNQIFVVRVMYTQGVRTPFNAVEYHNQRNDCIHVLYRLLNVYVTEIRQRQQ